MIFQDRIRYKLHVAPNGEKGLTANFEAVPCSVCGLTNGKANPHYLLPEGGWAILKDGVPFIIPVLLPALDVVATMVEKCRVKARL